MNGDALGIFSKALDIQLRTLNHQMHVEGKLGVTGKRIDNGESD